MVLCLTVLILKNQIILLLKHFKTNNHNVSKKDKVNLFKLFNSSNSKSDKISLQSSNTVIKKGIKIKIIKIKIIISYKINNTENKISENIGITIKQKTSKPSIENLIKRSNTLEEDKLMNKEYFNFIVERTSQGIFQLTCFINQNKKIFGYARTNMKTQKIYFTVIE